MSGARRTLKNLLENNPGASKQEIGRLFLDAIMTDPEFAEVLVREVQDQMFAFDADRARGVIRILIDDDPTAEKRIHLDAAGHAIALRLFRFTIWKYVSNAKLSDDSMPAHVALGVNRRGILMNSVVCLASVATSTVVASPVGVLQEDPIFAMISHQIETEKAEAQAVKECGEAEAAFQEEFGQRTRMPLFDTSRPWSVSRY
jgi:hypothetical protein